MEHSKDFGMFICTLYLDKDHGMEAQRDITELNEVLKPHGISCIYNDDKLGTYLQMFVNERALKRNAGARRKSLFCEDTSSPARRHLYTIGEVNQMRDSGMTASEIAQKLGINRATYFRRRKADEGKADSLPF